MQNEYVPSSELDEKILVRENQKKSEKRHDGLKIKFRKLLQNMKMIKSNQKCTICYSDFEKGTNSDENR